ncbi:MAG: hypothetical protein WAM82_23695 [Thermoanaerobaculia bacterium]
MSEQEERYSMDEVARAAEISYGTLTAFLKKHGDRIPSEKLGQHRFFPPRAVEIVKDIARENRARVGRHVRRKSRERSASDHALKIIDRAETQLERVAADLGQVVQLLLNNSGSVVFSLKTLAPHGLAFRQPVDVVIESSGADFVARLFEVNLSGTGRTRPEAMDKLRAIIAETYREMLATDREHWTRELAERAPLLRMLREAR